MKSNSLILNTHKEQVITETLIIAFLITILIVLVINKSSNTQVEFAIEKFLNVQILFVISFLSFFCV